MKKKKEEIKDIEVVPNPPPPEKERIRADRSIVLPTGKSDSEVHDQMTEALGGATGCMDVIVPDKRSQIAGLSISDLNPHRVFNKESPVLMVWDNRNNMWALFRSLDEVAETGLGEVEIYVALPTRYKKLKKGFTVAE